MNVLLRLSLVGGLLIGLGLPAEAQETYATVKGKILDPQGRPLVGFRVVFRQEGDGVSYISALSGADGEYVASLPQNKRFVPQAVVLPGGRRTILGGQSAFEALTGKRIDVQLGVDAPAVPARPPAARPAPTPDRPAPTPDRPAPTPDRPAPTPDRPAPAATPRAAPPAEVGFAAVRGRVLAASGDPVAGFRVAFRSAVGVDVFISLGTDSNGEYVVSLPEDGQYVAVAVYTPGAQRVGLVDERTVTATAGSVMDVHLDYTPTDASADSVETYPGSDRLFLSFVEDTALVGRWRFEDLIDLDSDDRYVSSFLAALQLRQLPQVEIGGRLGLGSRDLPVGFPDNSGLTDLDLWAKYDIGPTLRGQVHFSAGALMSWPVGDEESGNGLDAYRIKLFGAGRRSVPWGAVSFHAGIRLNGDGESLGVPLDGRTSVAVGAALIAPVTAVVSVIGEGTFESESYEGVGTAGRVLGGVNWNVAGSWIVRGALAFGFGDGAPDTQFIAGLATDF